MRTQACIKGKVFKICRRWNFPSIHFQTLSICPRQGIRPCIVHLKKGYFMYLSFMRTKVRFDVAFLNVIFGLKYVFGSWPSGQSLSVRTNIQNVSSALFQGGRSCPASVDCKRIPQRLHIANYDCMKTLVHVKYTLVEAGFFEVYSFILQKTLG